MGGHLRDTRPAPGRRTVTLLSDTPAPPTAVSPAVTDPEVPVHIEAVEQSVVEQSPAPLWPAPQWPAAAPRHEAGPAAEAVPATGRGSLPQAPAKAVLTGAPVHCGRPMPVRCLDPLTPDSQANHAVLEAAVAGQQVHACACGHLQCAPADPTRPQRLCRAGERSVFTGLFLHHVHAAAAAAESARWSFDHILTDAPAGTDAAARWLFDADLESAAWAMDAAELDLQEICALASTHGVEAGTLSRIAGAGDEEIPATGAGAPATTRVDDVQVAR